MIFTKARIIEKKITFQRSCLDWRVGIGGSSIFLSASSDTIQSYTLFQHALSKALLKPARLARFSPALVYLTLPVRRTRILDVTCEITRYFIVIYMVLVQVAPMLVSWIHTLQNGESRLKWGLTLRGKQRNRKVKTLTQIINCNYKSRGATWKILQKEILANARELFLPCIVLLKNALHASQDATP